MKYPTWRSPAGSVELLILAWFSRQNVRESLQQRQVTQPWGNPYAQLEAAFRARVDDALTCFQADPIFGPVLLDLVRHQLSLVDLGDVIGCITIGGGLHATHGAATEADSPTRV